MAVVDSPLRCGGVFAALAALHAYRVAHGDARLANLMVLPAAAEGAPPGGLAWIDMRAAVSDRGGEEGPLELPLLQRADALALARSVLGVGAEGTCGGGSAALGGWLRRRSGSAGVGSGCCCHCTGQVTPLVAQCCVRII